MFWGAWRFGLGDWLALALPGVGRWQMPRWRRGGELAGLSACAEGCRAAWISEI